MQTCIHHKQCISKEQAILKLTKLNFTSNSNRDIFNNSFQGPWTQNKTKWMETFQKLLVLTLQEEDNLKSNQIEHKILPKMLHQIEILDFDRYNIKALY